MLIMVMCAFDDDTSPRIHRVDMQHNTHMDAVFTTVMDIHK